MHHVLDENKIFLCFKFYFFINKKFIQTNISIALILVPICPEPAILIIDKYLFYKVRISLLKKFIYFKENLLNKIFNYNHNCFGFDQSIFILELYLFFFKPKKITRINFLTVN